MQAGEQQAVDQADCSTSNQCNDNHCDAAGHALLYHHTHQARAEDCVCTNRKLNAGGDQTEQHTNRYECVKRGLLEYAHDIVKG